MKLFKNFTGGDPDVAPLLKRRGLTKTAPADRGSLFRAGA
jgi:hypothetical protein